MSAVPCSVKGCKNWSKENGRCNAHSKAYEKRIEKEGDEKKVVMVEKEEVVIKNARDRYYGGKIEEPHIHVYPGGAHLKLGTHRFNLVQGGKKHAQVEGAREALDEHALGSKLRPWVDAALRLFNCDS